MDGRMYKVSEIKSFPRYGYEDNDPNKPVVVGYYDQEVSTDLFVPNGTWVMERPFGHGYSWLVGVSPDDVRCEPIDRRPLQERDLRLADKPFGYVCANQAYYLPGTDTQVPMGSMQLYCAEQIHKGELITGVVIPKLEFAREHPDNAHKMHNLARNRSQRRNPGRWARLSDVTRACGLSTYALMNDYWSFVGFSSDPLHNRCGELLHVRFGADREAISQQQGPHDLLTLEELGERIRDYGQEPSTIWIRAGLANTFLRLRALGYQPTIAA